jgi:farnesyl-diphosphate farnesyltransferase
MPNSSNQILLTSLLRDVSRSFYLTLRVLPRAVRPQIGLTYLLARTTDTIADTQLVPLNERLVALQDLIEHIEGTKTAALQLRQLTGQQSSPAERALLERCEETVKLLRSFSSFDQQLIVAVLRTIVSGQELDLRRFAAASSTNIVSLQTAKDLDDYTYRVAGCVGEFWTKICRAHVFPSADLDDTFLLANGVRFGKGLQLVNILRDLPVDLGQGRCYLPHEQLQAHRIEPRELLEPSNEPRMRPIYNAWLDQAHAHLVAGWNYTNRLPRRRVRVRLACAWPLLIGRQTLDLLRQGTVLNPNKRVKVTRRDVKSILWRTVMFYPWPHRWERLFGAIGSY